MRSASDPTFQFAESNSSTQRWSSVAPERKVIAHTRHGALTHLQIAADCPCLHAEPHAFKLVEGPPAFGEPAAHAGWPSHDALEALFQLCMPNRKTLKSRALGRQTSHAHALAVRTSGLESVFHEEVG
jgi:hypothetical protein